MECHYYGELKNHVEKVVELLGEKHHSDYKPILKLLIKRYEKLLVILNKESVNVNDVILYSIKGGGRAYLDSYSDYLDNPLLEKMSICEDIIEKIEMISDN